MIHAINSPPCGWNSFDSFGGYLHEDAASSQLEAQAELLAKHGYDTFVIDIGWYAEYPLKHGTLFPVPTSKHADKINLDSYGRPQPSRCYFPRGFKSLSLRAHQLGLKFGLHVMRGIPKAAVELRLPVKGTNGITAADIANRGSTCSWCHYNYGIDMAQPGAQSYHDSLVEQFVEWGVDFLKVDDITGYPREIQAWVNAIAKNGCKIQLSLSHGGETDQSLIPIYQKADMVRVTKDIWDDIQSIERSFHAWENWCKVDNIIFWRDLDMIPFGRLQVMSPEPQPGELADGTNPSLCGKGYTRECQLSLEERRTFITQRAMAASPLFVGGDLTTLSKADLELLTNPEMLACNRNGLCGTPRLLLGDVQVWHTPNRTDPFSGWLGVFNRNPFKQAESIVLTPERLKLPPSTSLQDVWARQHLGILSSRPHVHLPVSGCCFIAYTDKNHS